MPDEHPNPDDRQQQSVRRTLCRGLFGIVVFVVVLAVSMSLDGYKDYASRVRYRLVPGVW
jgi:hypothetical protein